MAGQARSTSDGRTGVAVAVVARSAAYNASWIAMLSRGCSFGPVGDKCSVLSTEYIANTPGRRRKSQCRILVMFLNPLDRLVVNCGHALLFPDVGLLMMETRSRDCYDRRNSRRFHTKLKG